MHDSRNTLKNRELLEILSPPDDPDGIRLEELAGELAGAGFPVPLVGGVPDFVTNAPVVRRSIECLVPNTLRPSPDVLKPTPTVERVPEWFSEKATKYEPLQKHAKGWLLDIGAGIGNRVTYERLGYQYVGIDADPAGMQSYSWGRKHVDLDLIADAHRLPIRSGSIQAINSTAVFEHLYNPALAAREIARVLAPGGLLVGSCSFLEGEHYDSQHHMTALGIYRLFTEAGLKVLSIYPAESLWEMHAPSLYLGLPFSKWLARIHERIYFALVGMKSREPVLTRRFRLSAILEFQAIKPD